MPFDHFSCIAPFYNRQKNYPSLEMLIETAKLPTEGILLDAGGGTGRVSSALKGYAKDIIVADPSIEMLRYAASKPGLHVVAGSSEKLPFPDDFFHRIIMVDALHHVIDQKKATSELIRVLKPGGLIVIEEPNIIVFGVKVIAFIEKVLLMRSRFLNPDQIADLFPLKRGKISTKGLNAWVVIEK